MAKLSTHILDTAHGCPAAGVVVELWRLLGQGAQQHRELVLQTTTNADGRTDQPLLQSENMVVGAYELVFHMGDYFAARGVNVPTPRFVDCVHLHFGISDANGNYHVPLLASPWSYSTYRGS